MYKIPGTGESFPLLFPLLLHFTALTVLSADRKTAASDCTMLDQILSYISRLSASKISHKNSVILKFHNGVSIPPLKPAVFQKCPVF